MPWTVDLSWARAVGRFLETPSDMESGRVLESALSPDEVRALAPVRAPLTPEQADGLLPDAARGFLSVGRNADDLRLPPPPGLNRTGCELQRCLNLVVSRFEASSLRPVSAPAAALEAEARMIAVSRGLIRFHRRLSEARDGVALGSTGRL